MMELSRFVLVGAFNTVWGYFVIFFCMYFLRLSAELSNVIGYVVALGIAYFLHRTFTFRSKNPKRQEFAMFVVIFLVAYAANLVSVSILVRVVNVNPYVAQILAGLVYVGVSYIMNKLLVFRPNGLPKKF